MWGHLYMIRTGGLGRGQIDSGKVSEWVGKQDRGGDKLDAGSMTISVGR